MKKLFTRYLGPALAALLALPGAAWALEVNIGVPDQGAGDQPFISGPVGLAHIHQRLEQAFAGQDVHIQWHWFKGAGPAVNEALAGEQLDIAWLGDLAAIIGRSNGLPTRLLLGARGANMYLATRPEANIHSLADLPGKRVAVYRGTADQLSFSRALAAVNLRERDLKVLSLDWAAARAALASGQIDAAWSGMAILALAQHGVAFPVSTRQLPPAATTQAGLVARQAFIDAHPEVVQQVVEVLVQEAAWASDPAHLAAYTEQMAARSHIPKALFDQELAGTDLNFRQSPRLDPFLTQTLQASADQAKALGLVRRGLDVSAWAEPRFVEQALRTLNLQALWPLYGADAKPLKDPQ